MMTSLPSARQGQIAQKTLLPAGASVGSGLALILLFIVLFIPVNMEIAGLRLSPYRIYLLVLFVPFLVQLLSGRAGALTFVDLGVALHATVIIVALTYHHGLPRFPYAVILALEMFGGYLIGRVLIRSTADYRRFVRFFLWTLVALAPLAAFELVTGRMILSEIFRHVMSVTGKNSEFRYGLSRVQVAFPHSILYGLFCSLALASTYYLYRKSFLSSLLRLSLVFAMTVMSLSSGPLLSAMLQVFLILWDRITRGSWMILGGLFLSAVLVLELFSNRGPVVFFIETMTLDPATGWWRIYIWEWGSRSVMAHPLLGIGLNDWVRPEWLTSSVDNFWLLNAMRYGLPGMLFLAFAVLSHAWRILRRKGLGEAERAARSGYMITLVGLVFVLCTVHVWNELAFFVMFFIGAGSFLYVAADSDAVSQTPVESDAPPGRHALPYSRFPQQRTKPAVSPGQTS